MKWVLLIFAGVLFLTLNTFSSLHAEEVMFVRAVSAKLRSGESPFDPIIQTLKKGSPVEILKRKGRFVLIRTSDKKEGWVFFRRLSLEKPRKEKGVFSEWGMAFRGKEASKTANSGAPRGIEEETQHSGSTGLED